ncbi:MAG: diphthamide synthesis protein [Nanobdellota archaeon]
MKALFLNAKYSKRINIPEEVIDKLPDNLAVFTSVQFIDQLDDIKRKLNAKTSKTKHTAYEGQVLGCNTEKVDIDADALLYIGDGKFHPEALAYGNDKPIYTYNPFTKRLDKLDTERIKKIKKLEKGALTRFHSSDNIGVIISVKPGQYAMRMALELKEKYPEKNFYFFMGNTIELSEFENYPFIEVFVNTTCPRLALDDRERIKKPIVNINKIISSYS